MVRLERIVLQGFKSFKRKSSLPLPPGFTVITGPNGSGKTNIGDSISFVLGRSSSRSLRAKKTENLIFHGNNKKGSSDYANVILYLNNQSKRLPFKEKEVSVGRKINKKGVSTYRLNGRVVTRQQVVDVLSQASIHPDGHNIIQQGDVNQLVDMDPIQRRKILDEISGIKEYDEKKNKAMKELERVGEKVREAEILLSEKSNVMEKLREERDAALEYTNLEKELVQVTESILLKEFSSAEEAMKKISSESKEKERAFRVLEKTIARLDKGLEKEEQSLASLTKEVIKASGQIEVSKKINALQSNIEARKMRIASLDREMERLDSLIDRVSKIENKVSPGVQSLLKLPGVKGVLMDLVVVPAKYRTAVEVGAGGHARDVVVDRMETAVRCVHHLKKNKLGRARFLPLNKILPGRKGSLPPKALGWLSDLVHFDKKYAPVMEYVFGRTACVDSIETAKEVIKTQRVRMVSLDGDLMEATGAVTGGYYRRSGGGGDVKSYLREKQTLIKEKEGVEDEIARLSKELSALADKEKTTKTFDVEKTRQGIDSRLESLREERKEATEQRLKLQQEMGKVNIQKARIEAKFDNLKLQVKRKKQPLEASVSELKQREGEIGRRLQEIGPVNLKSLKEFDAIMEEFQEFKEKVDKIAEERQAIQDSIDSIESRRRETFNLTLHAIDKNFKTVYRELTGGDASLTLEDERNVDTGMLIKASPGGKRLLQIDSMSGGEKTLTAFSFLFALQKHKPAPFYILDEADATLDKVNTQKLVSLLKKQSKEAQFLIISHNDTLVRQADQIFGVTMANGESKVMGVELPEE